VIEFDRSQGIGGSDVPIIVGMSPYRSAIDLWEEKRGQAIEREKSLAMKLGIVLEDGIAKVYAEQEGCKVWKPRIPFGLVWGLVGPDEALVPNPMIAERFGFPTWAQVDRVRVNRPTIGVEVKHTASLDRFVGGETPDDVAVQVQHAMAVTGWKAFDVVSLSGGRELAIDRIEADPEAQEAIADACRVFWQQVQDGTPPPFDGSDQASAWLRKRYHADPSKVVVATHDSLPMVAELLAAQAVQKEADRQLELQKQRIMGYMADAERFEAPGVTITWKDQAGSKSWKAIATDLRRFIEDNAGDLNFPMRELSPDGDDGTEWTPSEWLDFIEAMHTGEPPRVFRVYGKLTALEGRKEQA
jgi:predicted phage-related endonuclease